ncbi:DUF512 domain-containing protein [Acidaminobacter sp. JC074]|uniref:DUF512 domain-containing protein n=1 Tax=Acidaminobacter sp. JC074 TaxID=2530199 RepID=UPI001F0E966A|nr:DUF512 domain-containing protein [Acidaminobacter sp. JC074]MCH4890228.1 DUF512 domain-containing protein [Acidaminobacter sp. JC074]
MEKNYSIKDKNKIILIEKDSIAEELGLEIGDRVTKINGKDVDDIIDYFYLLADEYVEVEVEKVNGEVWLLEIDKDYYEELGVEFENPIMDKANHCSNNCVFCFIDQNPKGMRETLYFKDDDSRLSFLQGNFVTLTNMKQRDLERVVEYRISPLNVSIHATNPDVRRRMLNNRFAGDVLDRLKYLTEHDIEINGQIVLCPGYNDGPVLEETLRDLYALGSLHSVAIVPVGITKYRDGLAPLTIFDSKMAKETIEQVEKLQEVFLETGSRFAFLSDEFYILAEKEFPSYEAYEGFIQIENGVGLMKKFEYELEQALKGDYDLTDLPSSTILTGASAFEFISDMVAKIKEKYDVNVEVVKVLNDFYGHTITVAGLLTAEDLLKEAKKHELNEQIIIPDVMLRTGEAIFLDNVTLDEFEERVDRKVQVIKVEGQDFLDRILGR